jgi:hypothetical protein
VWDFLAYLQTRNAIYFITQRSYFMSAFKLVVKANQRSEQCCICSSCFRIHSSCSGNLGFYVLIQLIDSFNKWHQSSSDKHVETLISHSCSCVIILYFTCHTLFHMSYCISRVILYFTCHTVFHVPSCISRVILDFTCHRVFHVSYCISHVILYFTCHAVLHVSYCIARIILYFTCHTLFTLIFTFYLKTTSKFHIW